MDQGDLFTEQGKQLKRTKANLEPAILLWAKRRITNGYRQFHLVDLGIDLAKKGIQFAPGSPDRILRDMRVRQLVGYNVIDRSKSLYELTGCAMTGGQ